MARRVGRLSPNAAPRDWCSVEVDPDRVLLLDLNYTNNSWSATPQAAASGAQVVMAMDGLGAGGDADVWLLLLIPPRRKLLLLVSPHRELLLLVSPRQELLLLALF